MGPVLKKIDLVTWDNKKPEVMNATFASVFASKVTLQVPEVGGEAGARKVYLC